MDALRSGTPRAAAVGLLLAIAVGCSSKSSTQPAPSPPPSGGTELFSSGVFSSASPVHVFVHTFSNVGTYGYHCLVHGTAMSASVVVGGTFADSPVVLIHDNFFDSLAVHVKTGGYVKWVNVGGNHGVVND